MCTDSEMELSGRSFSFLVSNFEVAWRESVIFRRQSWPGQVHVCSNVN